MFALLALGFVIIYKATEVVNFAHGSLVAVRRLPGLRPGDAHRLVRRGGGRHRRGRARGPRSSSALLSGARGADQNSLALLTIGVDVIIAEEIVRSASGPRSRSSATPSTPIRSRSAGSRSSGPRRSRSSSALVLITAFFLAFRFTDWGVAMRAQAENREAAALMGIRSSRVTATAWVIAGALAGVAVLFMATQDFSGAAVSAAARTPSR